MPATRLFLFAGLATLVLATGTLAPPLALAAVAADVAILVAFALDLRRARATAVAAVRSWPPILAQGQPETVSIALESPVRRTVTLRLRHGLSPALAAAPATVALELPAGRRLTWSHPVEPRRRGDHDSGPLSARVLGPWKLAWSQRDLLPPEPLKVFPRVRWEGRTGRILELAHRRELGRSPLRHQGEGGEPYALREYRPGDPLSRIHWKASARHGHLVSREDTWERGVPLVVLLDAARAMAAVEGERSKLDHALAAALALARVGLGRGDRVTIVAYSDRIERVVRIHGAARGLEHAHSVLYDLEARAVEPAYDLVAERLTEIEPRRANVVLLTSIVDLAANELLGDALRRLRRRHRPILIHLEDADVRALAETPPDDVETAFALVSSLEILLANRRLARSLRRAGIEVVTTSADRIAWATISAYLEAARVGRR